jgi:hypothetical protein
MPGTNDLVNGSATLRLTGFNPYGSYARDKFVRIYPRPSANISVSPRDTVCSGQSINLTTDTAGVSAWQWMPGNYLSNEATYDTANSGGAGTHLIRLKVENKFQCLNADSVFLTFKNCTVIAEDPMAQVIIYPNPNNGMFLIESAFQQPGQVKISVSNEMGELVFSEESTAAAFTPGKLYNLTFLPDGIYMLSRTITLKTTSYKLIIRK